VKSTRLELAGLTAHIAGPSDATTTCVLLHGFGAPGDDLVSLAGALDPRVRFVFPEAPLALGGLYGESRAWWLLDLARLEDDLRRGAVRDRRNEVPEGLVEARTAVMQLIDQLQGLSPGQPDGQSPGQTQGQSQGQPHGQSPGQLQGPPQGQSPEQPQGQSLGQLQGLSPGQPQGQSPEPPQGQSPGQSARQSARPATPHQLVLGGFSQGAMLALDVALHRAAPPAGLILMSGTLIAESAWQPRMTSLAGVPVMLSHGRQDGLLPFSAAEVLRDRLTAGGARVDWQPFAGGHEIPRTVIAAADQLLRDRTG
jgi:predicted esterase